MTEFIILDTQNLYQIFGVGCILGFSLVMVCLLLAGFIHLFKDLTK